MRPWTLAFAFLTGCAITNPPGWEMRSEPPERIEATPWVPYGSAPVSWDLRGGDKILVDVQKGTVISGMGMYHADLRFKVAYASEPSASITCATEPAGPDVPRTRFGCWSAEGAAEPLTFWMAPGVDCPARHAAVTKTLTTPECWHGVLTLPDRTLQLRHGIMPSMGSPIGRVSWVSAKGDPLLVADIVVTLWIELFDPRGGPRVDQGLRRKLTLLTVALHWWEHASSD
ncbi:hypothetical protein [Chondromyces crocatus]|nr:hypothetical protein [Chondromyces crocatus]